MKKQKCETLYDDFVTAAATYFCGREGGKEGGSLRALRLKLVLNE